MDTTACISDELWNGYALKALSPAQLLALQKHAESCAMCADIKEGIDTMADAATLPQIVTELNLAVDKHIGHTKPRRKKITVWWYSSAAAVLLIALGIGWYGSRNAGTVSQIVPTVAKDTGKPVIKAPARENQAEIASPKNTPVIKGTGKDSIRKNNAMKDLAKAESDDKGESFITAPDTVSKPQVTLFDFGKDKSDKDDYKTADESKEIVTDSKIEVVQTQTPQSAKKYKQVFPADILSNNSYNNNNLNYNFNNTGYSLQEYYLYDSLNYNSAKQYYDKADYDSCHAIIDIATSYLGFAESEWREQFVLLRAKAYINQQKYAEAKTTLKSIDFTRTEEKKEAKGLLKELKNKK